MIVEREPKKQNCLVCLWLNKTRLGLIGLNYICFESTMPWTVHAIFVICIVRIDNSTCVEINGFLLYCCHCILVRSAIKSSDFFFLTTFKNSNFKWFSNFLLIADWTYAQAILNEAASLRTKKYDFSRFTISTLNQDKESQNVT